MVMLKIFILLLCVMLQFSTAYATVASDIAALSSGEWYLISSSKYDESSACPDTGVNNIPGTQRCDIFAYSSGAFDNEQDRYLGFGGGHSDYGGNELVAFNFNNGANAYTWQRIAEPSSVAVITQCLNEGGDCPPTGYYSDGLPRSRHTYGQCVYNAYDNGFECILARATFEDAVYYPEHDRYDFDTSAWLADNSLAELTADGANIRGPTVALANGDIWVVNDDWSITNYIYFYDNSANTWTKTTQHSYTCSSGTADLAIDETNNIMVLTGGGCFAVFDISTANPTLLTETSTGDQTFEDTSYACGLTYDSNLKLFVGYSGNSGAKTTYALKVDKNKSIYHWTAITGTGDVTPANLNLDTQIAKKWMYNSNDKTFYYFAAGRVTGVYAYKLSGEDSDTTLPVISGFTVPSTSETTTVTISSFTATDNDRVIGYQITTSPIPPIPWSNGWTTTAPATWTAPSAGVWDLYAWVHDLYGNVSRYSVDTVEVACTTKTVCSSGCDYTKISDCISWANGTGAGSICDIDADDNPWQSWKTGVGGACTGKGSDFYDNVVGNISSTGITIRGKDGTAYLQWLCHDNTISGDDYMVSAGTTTNGAMIHMNSAVNNLRIENVRIGGVGGEGSAVRVGTASDGATPNGMLYVKNCIFDENSNGGILTGYAPNLDVVIVESRFYNNGRFYENDGQYHNMYIGEVDEFVFFNSISRECYQGQLVKSRGKHNYIMYSRLTDEGGGNCAVDGDCSNQIIDLSYGGESYVIGNILEKSAIAGSVSFINFNPEQRFTAYFTNGGVVQLADGTTVTNSRTSHTWVADTVYQSNDYGFTGTWAGNDKTGAIALRGDIGTVERYTDVTPAHEDILATDTLTYTGGDIVITATPAVTPIGPNLSWSFGSTPVNNGHYVVNNTFINRFKTGSSSTIAIYNYADTYYSYSKNNLFVDLHAETPFILNSVSGTLATTQTTDSSFLTSDPGFTSLANYDLSLTSAVSGIVNAGTHPGQAANGFNLYPHYYYSGTTTPAKTNRTTVSSIDIGAYEYSSIPSAKGVIMKGGTWK